MLALPVDCLGDFGPRWLSVQYTQAVRVCSSAHTGRPCMSVSTHRTSVAVRQHTQNVCGCPSVHISARWTYVCVRQHTQDVRGCLSVPISARWTSVGVRQHTQDVRVCPSAHTGHSWLSVCVRVYPSAHTGRQWQSISTHISTLVLGLSTLILPVDCSGDFGPRGLSVQYTQDVHGCPPAHTGRPWLSVSVRVCPFVSVSTHRTSVAFHHSHRTSVGVRQHTQDVRGCMWLSVSTHKTSVAVSVCPSAHTGCLWVSISTHRTSLCVRQHTQDVRGCLCVSMCVRHHTQEVCGCPSVHISACWPWTQHAGPSHGLFGSVCSVLTGRLWVSASTHMTSVAVRQYTQDVRGCLCVSVCVRKYTQDVRGCPSAHIGHPCVSISTHRTSVAICVSMCVRQHTQDVRGRPSVHISARWSLNSARWPFPWTVWVILAHVVCLFSTHMTSVGVRQHTQDVCGCLCVFVVRQHTQDVPGCPSVSLSARWFLDSACWPFLWTVRVILAHVGCLFSTHRPSVCVHQHTQDVRVCPSAHTGRLWLSVSTLRTSVAVHQFTYQHAGPSLG
ncbi:hypothetical protein YC2023_066314 [Brassica napus]